MECGINEKGWNVEAMCALSMEINFFLAYHASAHVCWQLGLQLLQLDVKSEVREF
jgi:hypothetical protein